MQEVMAELVANAESLIADALDLRDALAARREFITANALGVMVPDMGVDGLVRDALTLLESLDPVAALAMNALTEDAGLSLNDAKSKPKSGEVAWITVKGQHIPVPEGKDRGEAIKEHFERLKAKGTEKDERAESHGKDAHGHAGHDPLEHAGHQAHTANDLASVHEALGGSHAAHAAIHAAHGAGEAAHAAGHAAHAATELDVAAIAARHTYGHAAKAISGLFAKVPGMRTVGKAVAVLHDKATKLAEAATNKLVERYGQATAGAILGIGAVGSHTVQHAVGLHGPAANAIPGPQFIGAIPLLAVAEVGKRLGLVGSDTKLEKGLKVVGTWVHALRGAVGRAAGKVTSAVGKAGLKAVHAAGKAVGEALGTTQAAERFKEGGRKHAETNNQAMSDNAAAAIAQAREIVRDAALTLTWNELEQAWEESPHEVTENDLLELLEVEHGTP